GDLRGYLLPSEKRRIDGTHIMNRIQFANYGKRGRVHSGESSGAQARRQIGDEVDQGRIPLPYRSNKARAEFSMENADAATRALPCTPFLGRVASRSASSTQFSTGTFRS